MKNTTTNTKPTTKELMKLRQQKTTNTTTIQPTKTITKKIELTKTENPNKKEKKIKSLTTTISYSQKFNTKTIRTEEGNLMMNFEKSGENSRGTKLIFNKIK